MNSGWSEWPAPAKLNLFLRITGRRADGYHELQTVFRLLDWGDRIRLRPRSDGRIVRHGDRLPGVDDLADLAVRAANLLQSSANCPQGADIEVEKRIPAGGGLVCRSRFFLLMIWRGCGSFRRRQSRSRKHF